MIWVLCMKEGICDFGYKYFLNKEIMEELYGVLFFSVDLLIIYYMFGLNIFYFN